jgi:hypothetical protein
MVNAQKLWAWGTAPAEMLDDDGEQAARTMLNAQRRSAEMREDEGEP